jgi:hypothetical protein
MVWPIDQMVCPLHQMVCSLDQMVCSLDQMVCPQDQMACALDKMVCPLDQTVCPQNQMFCPPQPPCVQGVEPVVFHFDDVRDKQGSKKENAHICKLSVDLKQYSILYCYCLAVWKYVKDGHKEKGWALTQDSLDRRRYSSLQCTSSFMVCASLLQLCISARDLDVMFCTTFNVYMYEYVGQTMIFWRLISYLHHSRWATF